MRGVTIDDAVLRRGMSRQLRGRSGHAEALSALRDVSARATSRRWKGSKHIHVARLSRARGVEPNVPTDETFEVFPSMLTIIVARTNAERVKGQAAGDSLTPAEATERARDFLVFGDGRSEGGFPDYAGRGRVIARELIETLALPGERSAFSTGSLGATRRDQSHELSRVTTALPTPETSEFPASPKTPEAADAYS